MIGQTDLDISAHFRNGGISKFTNKVNEWMVLEAEIKR